MLEDVVAAIKEGNEKQEVTTKSVDDLTKDVFCFFVCNYF